MIQSLLQKNVLVVTVRELQRGEARRGAARGGAVCQLTARDEQRPGPGSARMANAENGTSITWKYLFTDLAGKTCATYILRSNTGT